MSKLPGTGGLMSEATCKEQLLYEVQDPAYYFCPDVVADMTKVSFTQIGNDEVEILIDQAGIPQSPTLKALVGLREGFLAEGLVLFGGLGALERAELTKDILLKRFKRVDLQASEVRMDYIGLNSVYRESTPPSNIAPHEIILRIATKTTEQKEAEKLRREIKPLAVNGTAGTGKWATSAPGSCVQPVIGLNSALLVPRSEVSASVVMVDANGAWPVLPIGTD
jgi:hypothetical protein